MGATARFHTNNAIGGQKAFTLEAIGIFLRQQIIGDNSNLDSLLHQQGHQPF
jgi:hypothetical protein